MPDIFTREIDATACAALSKDGIEPRMARLFAARGVTSADDLKTTFAALLPPGSLLNIDKAATLLADAIEAKQRLLIIADYDADGATACAVGMKALSAMGATVDFLVPNRFEYGYGLTPEIVHLAFSQNATQKPHMLITVDNGIASVDGVAEANRLGMQVLVTDHHLPGDTLPDAACIVNPNQPGCNFASKNLAGVGVMFYVMLALRAELRSRGAFTNITEPNLATLLDLVALGTVADVVKLDHNNRIFVEQGLAKVRANKASPGISALLQVAGRNPQTVSTYDFGFVLGPRINAAGRLTDMSLGIHCLLAESVVAAQQLATQLDNLNRERRLIESGMKDEALVMLEETALNVQDQYSICLFNARWHQGVIGILASRIREKTHRPVIAFARDSAAGMLKGSGRSIAALHLRDALDLVSKRHPDMISKFGGHAMAAGLSLPEAALPAFTEAFEQVTQMLLMPTDLDEHIATDGVLKADEIDITFVRNIERLIWGQGFPSPSFQGTLHVLAQAVVGEKHLKLRVSIGNKKFEAIRFGSPDFLPETVNAVYRLSINQFRGNETLQLIVEHTNNIL